MALPLNPGFAFDGENITSVANNAAIGVFTPTTGVNFTPSGASILYRQSALNGFPAIEFIGGAIANEGGSSAGGVITASDVTFLQSELSGAYTMVMLVKATNLGSGTLFAKGASSGTGHRSFLLYGDPFIRDARPLIYKGNNSLTGSTPINDGNFHLIFFEVGAGTTGASIQDGAGTPVTGTVPAINPTAGIAATIGAAGNGNYCGSFILPFARFYARTLTAQEKTDIRDYVATKYGVGVSSDTANPTASAAIATNGTTITVTLNEPGTGTTGFSVQVAGSPRTVSNWTQATTTTITGTLASTVYQNQAVTFAYDASTGNVLDTAGNEVQSFSGTTVNNGSIQPTPVASNPYAILGIGDSRMQGYQFNTSAPATSPMLTVETVLQALRPGNDFIIENKAEAGTRTSDWLPNGSKYLAAKAAGQAIGATKGFLALGTNDAQAGGQTSKANYKSRILTIANAMLADGFVPHLCDPPDIDVAGATAAFGGLWDASSNVALAGYRAANAELLAANPAFKNGDTESTAYFDANPGETVEGEIHLAIPGGVSLGKIYGQNMARASGWLDSLAVTIGAINGQGAYPITTVGLPSSGPPPLLVYSLPAGEGAIAGGLYTPSQQANSRSVPITATSGDLQGTATITIPGNDSINPVLSTVAMAENGNSALLTFSEVVTGQLGFMFTVNGANYSTVLTGAGNTRTATFARTVYANQLTAYSYTGTNIKDAGLNPLLPIGSTIFANNSTATPPVPLDYGRRVAYPEGGAPTGRSIAYTGFVAPIGNAPIPTTGTQVPPIDAGTGLLQLAAPTGLRTTTYRDVNGVEMCRIHFDYRANSGCTFEALEYNKPYSPPRTTLEHFIDVPSAGGILISIRAMGDDHAEQSLPSQWCRAQKPLTLNTTDTARAAGVVTGLAVIPQWQGDSVDKFGAVVLGGPRNVLTWLGGVAKYNVYKNGTLLAGAVTLARYVDTSVTAGEVANYQVARVENAGIANFRNVCPPVEGTKSAAVSVTTVTARFPYLSAPVVIKEIIAYHNSAMVYVEPVAGAADYRAFIVGREGSYKYAGAHHVYVRSGVTRNENNNGKGVSIHVNGLVGGEKIVVQAVDKLGPYYLQRAAAHRHDGFAFHTNGQGDPSNIPYAIAESAQSAPIILNRMNPAEFVYFEDFEGPQPITNFPFFAVDPTWFDLNDGRVQVKETPKLRIEQTLLDNVFSEVFFNHNLHFMNISHDGDDRGGHVNNAVMLAVLKAQFDISNGKAAQLKFSADMVSVLRKWVEVQVYGATDVRWNPGKFIETNLRPSRDCDLMRFQFRNNILLDRVQPPVQGSNFNYSNTNYNTTANLPLLNRSQANGFPGANGTERELDKPNFVTVTISKTEFHVSEECPFDPSLNRSYYQLFGTGKNLPYDSIVFCLGNLVYHSDIAYIDAIDANGSLDPVQINKINQMHLYNHIYNDERHWGPISVKSFATFPANLRTV